MKAQTLRGKIEYAPLAGIGKGIQLCTGCEQPVKLCTCINEYSPTSYGWCKSHLVKAIEFLKDHRKEFNPNDRDWFEFGVYRGESAQLIENLFYAYQIPVHRGYGFDSFQGLPQESPGIPKFYIFQPGMFADVGDRLFWTRNTIFVKGWFSDLPDNLIKKTGMLEASLVYIDSDLYISACQALDFMFRNKLIVPGTVLAYDEYKSTEPLLAGGEAKAHKEICEKYNVIVEEIYRNEYVDQITIWQNAFVIRKVG